ncbi:MAG: methyltransferase domain-containing protein [Myxococcota bacterium]|nr:methyltransferase domain-containing protein [Myxococcota bacterium]
MAKEQDHTDSVRTVFDKWADSGRGDTMAAGHEISARYALEQLGLQPGERFLDIGCGIGYSVRWAASYDETIQAYGVDVSEQMIERARTLSTDLPNARFINSSFPLPILRAKSFHRILSIEAFYYFHDLPWAVLSTARLLAPGGLFACVVDFYEENVASHDWPDMVGVPLKRLSAQQWASVMTDIGLELVVQERIRHPLVEGEPPSWQQTEGSLLTIARRPLDEELDDDHNEIIAL